MAEQGWPRWRRGAWAVVNGSTAPAWLLLIAAPRSSLAARVVPRLAPLHLALGMAYGAFLARGVAWGGERVDFTDGESVARALSRPDGALAGWAHYITFDLVVGTWVWRTALEDDLDPRLALLLTWWAGPSGLVLFLWQRRRAGLPARAPGLPADG